MVDDPIFDVVVTSYRRPAHTLKCVESVLAAGPLLSTLWVVDDASGDDTVNLLRRLDDKRLKVVERSINGGIGAARRDGFELSKAEWTVGLDSDHTLAPNALSVLKRAIRALPPGVGIIGGRYAWDHGGVTPERVPAGVVDYRRRASLSSEAGSIGADYVMCVSREVRARARWQAFRAGLVDALFQLDAARESVAVFVPDILAAQVSDAPNGYSRLPIGERLARRRRDAADGVAAATMILSRHDEVLRRNAPKLRLGILEQAIMFAALSNDRGSLRNFAKLALSQAPTNTRLWALSTSAFAGPNAFEFAYKLATTGGGLIPALTSQRRR